MPSMEELRRRSRDDGECWIWTGAKTGKGYGRVKIKWTHLYVHRIAYELAHGPIPAGCEIHHTCERKACVNPKHLRAVTRAEHKGTLHPLARDVKGRFLPN